MSSVLPLLALAGCAVSPGTMMSQIDAEYVENAALIEVALSIANTDPFLSGTQDYVDALNTALGGRTLTIPFDDTVADPDDVELLAADLAADIVGVFEAHPSFLLNAIVEEESSWEEVETLLATSLVTQLSLTLDDLQPADFIWEYDDCTKARIDKLTEIRIDIESVTATADADSLRIGFDLGAPVVEIEEMRLWHDFIWCSVDTLEDVSFGLPDLSFEAGHFGLELDVGSEDYDWPTVSVSATRCGGTAVIADTVHDVLYGPSGPPSAAGYPIPSGFDYSYLDASFGATAASELGDLTDDLEFSDIEISVSGFWDAVEIGLFVIQLVDELIDVIWDWMVGLVEALIDIVGDWLTPDAGSSGGGGGGGGGGGPSGDPLYGEHVALLLSFAGGSSDVSISLDDYTTDEDLDSVLTPIDNCPEDANSTQLDSDYDGIGNTCDPIADMGPIAINLKLDAWREDMQPIADMAAMKHCFDLWPIEYIFEYAGILIPPLVFNLPEYQVENVIAEMQELLQRIFDRYREEWPGPSNDLPWITQEVQAWRATVNFLPGQKQLIGDYLNAMRVVMQAQFGENAEAVVILTQVRQVVMQWPPPQPPPGQ